MIRTFILLLALTAVFPVQAAARHLERVTPEQAGMDSRRLQYADSAILCAVRAKEIPGAVLAVVRHGKMAYLKAYGNRRTVPTTEPMTTETIFDMASCTKPVATAMCVMRLVELGRIRLMDPVSLYIPGFKDWTDKDGDQTSIRLHHLLTHSSGLPPYVAPVDLVRKYGKSDRDTLLKYIATCRRDFQPATDFQYSCLNFITLQRIVERVSGQSLRQFARTEVFGPLGMDHTDFLPCRQNEEGIWVNTDLPCWATPSERETLQGKNIPLDAAFLKDVAPTEKQKSGQVLCGQVHDPLARISGLGISGNAGLFTTADDVALLCAMLQNGGSWNGQHILSPLTVKAMRTVPRQEATLGRTLGWDCFTAYASNNGDLLSPSTYSHTGYTGTSIVIDPENDVSVILLTNAVHPSDDGRTVRLRSLVSNIVAAAINDSITTATASPTNHYSQRTATFQNEPPITSTDIVMLGNSLTENGGDWSERLADNRIRNRGIIGDDAPGLYERLHQILPGQPDKIFLMIGINDISHDLTVDSVATAVRRIVTRIRRESPHTRLYLQSLLPIDETSGRYRRLIGKTDTIPAVNRRLRTIARQTGATFVNLFPHFCQKKGVPALRKNLTTDGLHLNEEGYALWVQCLKKYI